MYAGSEKGSLSCRVREFETREYCIFPRRELFPAIDEDSSAPYNRHRAVLSEERKAERVGWAELPKFRSAEADGSRPLSRTFVLPYTFGSSRFGMLI